MKKYKNVLYIVDNYLYLYNYKKNDIIKYKLINVLKDGKIANINLFIKKYKVLLKDEDLNTNVFGDTITIIHHPEYTNADKELLKKIFINLNYRKINFINEMKIYKLNTKNAILNYNNEYCILSYINKYKEKLSFFIPSNFFSTDEFYRFIKKRIKKKQLFIFGNNSKIDDMVEKFEKKYDNECYHYINDSTYLLDLFVEK